MHTILICDDHDQIREILLKYLKREGFRVLAASSGQEAIKLAKECKPNLILLDISLGDMTGFEVMKELMQFKIPTIILSARTEITDKIVGLEFGADDYVTKPFDLREVALRVRALLKRSTESSQSVASKIIYEQLEMDINSKTVKKAGKNISLTPKEFQLMAYLAQNKDRAVGREELLTKILGYDFYGDVRTVDIQVLRLRKKIEDDVQEPRYIVTVFGFGYRFGRD